MSEQRFNRGSSSPSLTRALAEAFEHVVPGGGVYYKHNQGGGRFGQTGLGGAGGSEFDDPSEDPAPNEFSDRFTVADAATVRYEISDTAACHVEGQIAIIRNGKQKGAFFTILSDGTTPKFSFSGAGAVLPGPSDETLVAISAEIHSGALKIKAINSGAAALTATVDISFKVKKW
ncbi:hypothetical protein IT575_12220 [bacterium]|nr:hypothetical protein [bacterium]